MKTTKAQGMSLLEVMVALAIFATAGLTLIRATTQHINTLSRLEARVFAGMVAENQLAHAVLGEYDVKGSKNGESEFAGQTWYWQLQTGDTVLDLFDTIDAIVYENDDRKHQWTRIRTYLDSPDRGGEHATPK